MNENSTYWESIHTGQHIDESISEIPGIKTNIMALQGAMTEKAKKPTTAAVDNIATLTANGDLKNSGLKIADIGAGPHAATHASGGDDPVTPASIGAATVAALGVVEGVANAAQNTANAALPMAGGTVTGPLTMGDVTTMNSRVRLVGSSTYGTVLPTADLVVGRIFFLKV